MSCESNQNKEDKIYIGDNLSYETLRKILDNVFDEIFVYDNNYNVIYVNRACERHYGIKPSELIGKTFHELIDAKYWYPSVLPNVYQEKRRMTIEQTSYLGEVIITTAVPIFNDREEIELVVMSVQDKMNEIVLSRKKLEDELKKTREDGENKESDNAQLEKEEVIISRNKVMNDVIKLSDRVSKVDTTILIRGESGTGKGILVKYIHKKSKRMKNPLLTINCAAIPEDLLESELFGYVKGAFTGANETGKIGLLELADRGTLFLDEIGELSPKLQAKLLHVIQEKEFMPIGSRITKTVDIRIIAATNRDLLDMVKDKRFREDLYWRLNVIEIEIPPLCERPEDIMLLSNYFLNKFNEKYNYACLFSEECLNFFIKYRWPGNVRQLENIVERLVVTSSNPTIQVSDLPGMFFKEIEKDEDEMFLSSFELAKERFEEKLIKKAYEQFKSSRRVASKLDISQSKASRLIKKYCDK